MRERSRRRRRDPRVWLQPDAAELMPLNRDWLAVRRDLDAPRRTRAEAPLGPVVPCGGSACMQILRFPHVRVTATLP